MTRVSLVLGDSLLTFACLFVNAPWSLSHALCPHTNTVLEKGERRDGTSTRLAVKYRDGRDRHASFSSGSAKRNSVFIPSAPCSFCLPSPTASNDGHRARIPYIHAVGKREEEKKREKKKEKSPSGAFKEV